jgi:ubiquinone/menaquinone biosynthesis C-methylase UbiE
LEVGCGTGHFTRWFAGQGLRAAGLDVAAPMLAEALWLDGLPYLRGNALTLPFADDSFDVAAFVTTLEFVAQPVAVLAEALRVARKGLILGVLNRQSLLGWRLRREDGPIWGVARFFSPAQLVEMVHKAAGEAMSVTWRTALWPIWPGALPLPWGGFIGMTVQRR